MIAAVQPVVDEAVCEFGSESWTCGGGRAGALPVYFLSGMNCRAAWSAKDCSSSSFSTTSLTSCWTGQPIMAPDFDTADRTAAYLWTRALAEHQVVVVGHVAQAVESIAHVDFGRGGVAIIVQLAVGYSPLVVGAAAAALLGRPGYRSVAAPKSCTIRMRKHLSRILAVAGTAISAGLLSNTVGSAQVGHASLEALIAGEFAVALARGVSSESFGVRQPAPATATATATAASRCVW